MHRVFPTVFISKYNSVLIYILTGPIHSGKTSALRNWCQGRNDVDGLLSPDDDSGTRYFYEIAKGNSFAFEATASDAEPTITVGPFRFLTAAFERANRYLTEAAKGAHSTYLVLDELGKLELKDKGLHEGARLLIPQFQESTTRHLVLVIRDTLVEAAIAHYKIGHHRLLRKEELLRTLD